MRLQSIGKTLAIYGRWGWLSANDAVLRWHLRRRLKHPGAITFTFHSPGLGLFAHLNWCLWLAGWAEKAGRQCHFECTSPNYGSTTPPLDWLPHIFKQKSPNSPAGYERITIRRWEWLPFSFASGVPVSLKEARELFRRHFSVSDALAARAEAFVAAHYGRDFIIGLHYRGTDKFIEASRTTYDDAVTSIERSVAALQAGGVSSVAVFVATDEQRFVEYIQQKLPAVRVLAVDDVLRSVAGESIHAEASPDGLRKAQEAMIDALLLGQSHLLLKTASTLSGWAPILGNSMPVVLLSKPFDRCNWFPDAVIAESSHRAGQEADAVTLALSQR